MVSQNSEVCFVIMPFSKTTDEHSEEYWTNHFENFLKPLIESCGDFTVSRSEPLRGDILHKIIEDIVYSPLVVAELTDYNPNVFWELGVRQSFTHGTITIAEIGTKIPFNLSTKGCLKYSKKISERKDFCNNFRKAICDWLSKPESSDSHVLEITGRSIYNRNMKKALHHATLITDNLGLLTDSSQKRSAARIIPREVNTIKNLLRPVYPFCQISVQKAIKTLSEKGTIICGFVTPEQLLEHRTSIGHWASSVKDVRLNLKSTPFKFDPDEDIDLSMIKF